MVIVSQPKALNNIILGILTGIIVPLIFFFLYFIFRIHDTPFSVYFKFLVDTGKIVHVMSLSVVPNLAPFFLFLNSSRFRSAKGILGSTIFIAILIFVIKLI